MMFFSSSPTKVPAFFATAIRSLEAMTFSSSRSTRPMTAMLGSRKIMLLLSLMATYCVPLQFSMYQTSSLSQMNTPEAYTQP